MKVIYIDVLFAVNFIIDFLLVNLTARLRGNIIGGLRAALAAALGGAMAAAAFFLPESRFQRTGLAHPLRGPGQGVPQSPASDPGDHRHGRL